MQVAASYAIVYAASVLGIIWAIINYLRIAKINVRGGLANQDFETQQPVGNMNLLEEIGGYIATGAKAFLFQEYAYIAPFVILMFIVICLVAEKELGYFYTAIAFLLGAITSCVCGWIGMQIAVFSNYRTTYKAQFSLSEAFKVAYQAGCVMGFSLVSISLIVLLTLVIIYKEVYNYNHPDVDKNYFWESIAGYGLGGSTIALFGRVGGGIFTKAADVGADLVGKLEQDLPEDSPKNPATIADNVGDNVGDIAGMGADLFGSFAESTCAALVVGASFEDLLKDENYILYPIVLSAFGIFASFLTSLFATDIMKVNENQQIQSTLKYQLIISSVLLTPLHYVVATIMLPKNFKIQLDDRTEDAENTYAFYCAIAGLWAGFVIGWFTEYYTSHSYAPVREVARSCETGAATNIIYGLALGYLSTIIPAICIAITAYLSHKLLGMFGVAISALGMLSNLCIGLAIDAYGPISDNAGGIAEMSELGEEVREKTDALDAAGNTTAAIGKGFAIGSAALVSLSLYGAYITRARISNFKHKLGDISVTSPLVFSGLLIGAMLPYAFSAFTMKSVGFAAKQMVEEVREQLRMNPKIITGEENPDYERCVKISTQASLKEMFAPGALVIVTPLLIGAVFGPKAIAGLLPGALVSGVQMAISASNTGGAWDNAKKYIESGQLFVNGVQKKKGSDEHKAAVTGDTVGDPLKDTSGPSLNILIKLSAILSLVFARLFGQAGWLVCALKENVTEEECK